MTKINTKIEFEAFVTENWKVINQYIDELMSELPVPIYSSVDIRESKNKFAPVDHNMYPAGFNNVCALDLEAATNVFSKVLKKYTATAKSIAIIPESHTKNTFYLDHLVFLGRAIQDAGYEVRYLSLDHALFEEGQTELNLLSFSKFDIKIEKGEIKNGLLESNSVSVDFAILNNDQSSPLDFDWDTIKTPIHPTPKIGWFRREKTQHFCFYKEVATAFAEKFEINPDLIQARFRKADEIDFSSKEGFEILAKEVDELKKDLPEDTKVFIKASQGTYGMGISVVQSGEEVLSMNRKKRNKMDVGKNKIKFTSVIIQEGVDTIIKYDDMPAEVAIYLVDGKSIGGFMRANEVKDAQSNLNAKGMVFKKYCISEIREKCEHQSKEAVYSVIARLATLASAHEIKEVL